VLYGQSSALFIDQNGNVGIGIGNSTPQNLLHVGSGTSTITPDRVNAVIASQTVDAGIAIAQKDNVNVLIQAAGAGGYIGTTSNHPLMLRTNNADRVAIDKDGNVSLTGTLTAKKFTGDEALFLGRDKGQGIVSITNNAYKDENDTWQIKDKSKNAFTLEIRNNGTLDLYGTQNPGQTDWRHMARFDAVNNQVDFLSSAVKLSRLTQHARYQIDNRQEEVYDISPRYHLSLIGEVYGGESKTIPPDTLQALCADPDGCQVRMAMTRWDNNDQTESASVFFMFYYSPTDDRSKGRRWRASQTDAADASGVDGNGATQHIRNIWNTCFFTDGVYSNKQDKGDTEQGLQLHVSTEGAKNPKRTCELTLID
jgi:hypothetical protein